MRPRATVAVFILASSFALAACTSNVSLLKLGPMPSGVTMDSRVQYYDVSAASLTELHRAMAALGPRAQGRAWQAATETDFRWTFQYDRQGLSCEVRRVRVQLRTLITFPRWNPTAQPDSSLMAWWLQLNTGLMEHERGHAMISVETARTIIKELEGMSGMGCDVVGSRANAAGQSLLMRSHATQEEYDRTTRHGSTQIQQAGRLRSP